ncbi:MAG: ComEC/Rec2 family competence protein [Intrasporangium sp.]|uniref:ComEC/Rec2 family competence protein n=1 Tax=Intrasporangium sp. TaxID=1925024 RepID=UPI002647DBC8|nr:ComEC/Rec2 family competence protein [Intrasporangium sp.]MDN5794967.1 ComEC/Rec2 family competence protein [Intrasporangium sp.]
MPHEGPAGPRSIVKRERRLDLRLLAPVLLVWPVVAFVGLVAPVSLVVLGAVGATLASVLLVASPWAWWVRRQQRRPASARRARPVPPWRRLAALSLAGLALALVAVAGHRAARSAGPVDSLARERAIVSVRALLATDPREVVDGIRDEQGARPRVVVRVLATQVTARGLTTAVRTPLLVLADAGWARLEWRDEVEFTARLDEAQPGDDVLAAAAPRGPPRLISRAGGVFTTASWVRARFRAATEHLPAEARGLVPALVIGDSSRTPTELTSAMLVTGLSHLSAVSGSNVTLVLATAIGTCGVLRIGRRHRPWVALVLLAAFVVLCRPEPSVVRAAVMGTVGLVGLSTSRRQVGLPALAGAVLLLLVWDPWLARSYGFALSVVATLGLLVFAQPWGRAIGRCLPARMRGLGPILAVPVAAQVVCAPVVVPLQGSVSVVAVFANLLAAPLVAPTTIAGVVVALVSTVWVGGAGLAAWAAALPAQGIAWVARSCAGVPWRSFAWDESAWGAVVLAALTVAVILVAPWAWYRSRTRPLLALAVVAVTAAFVVPTSVVAWPPPGWVLVACDVGEGDGFVVANGPGHAVVVDTGTEPAVIDSCLDRLGVHVVDLVVLTHFHADHAGGLAGVLEGRQVGEIRVSTVKEPLAQSRRVAGLAAEAGVPVAELRAGDSWSVGQVSADVWWPGRRITEGSVPNNGSVAMTLRVRGLSVLMTGDLERESAAELVRAARADPARWGRVDVLKVAHHGSSNRDDRILDSVAGRLALISVGADNDYGHPAPSVLAVLGRRGFDVHRTDLEGALAVVVEPDGAPGVRSE